MSVASDDSLQNLETALLKECRTMQKADVGCQKTPSCSVTCQTSKPILNSLQTSQPSTPRLLKDLTVTGPSNAHCRKLLLSEPISADLHRSGQKSPSMISVDSPVLSIKGMQVTEGPLPTVVCVSRVTPHEDSPGGPDGEECPGSLDASPCDGELGNVVEERSPRTLAAALSSRARLPAPATDRARVKEIYFNRNVNMSDVAVDWNQCMNDECDQSMDLPNVVTHSSIRDPKTSICAPMQESGASSLGSSGGCDAARAQYYHNKLLATLQILENKEQQCAVQGESLAVAEARIAALGARAAALKADLDKKAAELRELRKSMSCCAEDKPHTCVAVQTSPQSPEEKEDLIKHLKDHISVIEELYRECFYESAKQDHLIELLREGASPRGELGRLRRVVAAQKRSLDQCQDIASEVENLKVEISNFLNSSNNDSGVWESSAASSPALGGDLHDILAQLLQLRDLLANDCSCGLDEENKKLKEITETLQIQIGALRDRAMELESAVSDRDSTMKQLKKLKQDKEQELEEVRTELHCAQKECCKQRETCDCLQLQLQQTEVLLQERTEELETERRRREECTAAREELQHRLQQAEQSAREKATVQSEVQSLRRQVCRWRAQLAASEQRVRHAKGHAERLHMTYREKSEAASQLQAELCSAQARGAALCARAHALTNAARRWLADMRGTHREQEQKIKEQQCLITELQYRLERCGPRAYQPGPAEPRVCLSLCDSEEERGQSCASAPVPPRRVLKKRIYGEASVQQPARAEASAGSCGRRSALGSTATVYTTPISPAEELEGRVEQLQAALAHSRRPWPCCTDHLNTP